MKKIPGLLFIMLSASIIQAQSVENLFAQMENLMAKAKGQVFVSHSAISKNKVKLGRQEFSQSSVVCSMIDKYETNVTHNYSIPWGEIEGINYLPADGNDKLILVRIFFKSLLKSKRMYESSVFSLEVYALRKDISKVRDIMDKIVDYYKKG